MAFEGIDDLGERHVTRVDADGIVGGDHGCDGAGRVARVAFILVGEYLLDGDLQSAFGEVNLASFGADGGVRGEKELASGIGKHDCALIATLGDGVS